MARADTLQKVYTDAYRQISARIPLRSRTGPVEPIRDSFSPGEAQGAAVPNAFGEKTDLWNSQVGFLDVIVLTPA